MDEGYCIRASSGGFHHSCGGRGKNGGGGVVAGGTKCGRWNPTAEQVKVLTELFRAGLRTPSTDQIQKISTQLSFYGKIENKNVFYWFQNHKARERQKRRRVDLRFHEDPVIALALAQQTKSSKPKSPKGFNEIKLNNIEEQEEEAAATTTGGGPPPSDNYNEHIVDDADNHHEREVVETLQLFPLTSYDDPQPRHQLLQYFTCTSTESNDDDHNQYKENTAPFLLKYGSGAADVVDITNHHPPLDLRLSSFP